MEILKFNKKKVIYIIRDPKDIISSSMAFFKTFKDMHTKWTTDVVIKNFQYGPALYGLIFYLLFYLNVFLQA